MTIITVSNPTATIPKADLKPAFSSYLCAEGVPFTDLGVFLDFSPKGTFIGSSRPRLERVRRLVGERGRCPRFFLFSITKYQ